MTKDTRDDSSPAGRAVPPSLLERWVFAVATMLDTGVAARSHALAEQDAERHGA